jgi:hypothetical protein
MQGAWKPWPLSLKSCTARTPTKAGAVNARESRCLLRDPCDTSFDRVAHLGEILILPDWGEMPGTVSASLSASTLRDTDLSRASSR